MVDTIGLIRHGSTPWNVQGRVQGQMNTDLSDEGRSQAHLLGLRLLHEQWDGMISSDLNRARETAEIIARHASIPLLHLDDRLRERNFGQIEGTTEAERIDRFGPHWRDLDLGIESNQHIHNRWVHVLAYISNTFQQGFKILIVSHGNYIIELLKMYELEQQEYLQNTSLTVIEREHDVWRLGLYNSLTHLDSSPGHTIK